MAKVAGFAKAFVGRWRIVEMDVWDSHFFDLVEEAQGESDGEIAFGTLKASWTCATAPATDRPAPSSHWKGHDENDPSCGRGWAMIGTAGRLVGHFYIHNGEESGFVCERG